MTAPGRPAHGCAVLAVIAAAFWPLILGIVAWLIGVIGKALH